MLEIKHPKWKKKLSEQTMIIVLLNDLQTHSLGVEGIGNE